MSRCTGYGDCRQGRSPCRTPLTCSGAPVDEAIEHFRLHRIPYSAPAQPDADAANDAFDRRLRWAQFAAALVAGAGVLLILLGALQP